ncbi:ABC-F family ATP-binding cassette domain-containing protein [Candidatus Woesebacteria bacterium]|nr:MAG: ABC-F family ATP-binding cassette domain-containing protein [Candidatus Woesebacteria bacterium]
MIIGHGISKNYGTENILSNISFKAGNGRKIGVVGANGCGKTTLFKIIAGEISTDSGSYHNHGETIGYVPQEFEFPDVTIGEYLKSKLSEEWEEYKIDILISKLKYVNYNPEQKISTLSEGQKMKAKMIEMLLVDPTILIIDEPTNHLDIEGIVWFENYIKNLNETVLLISHDRQFLNMVVDEIWEIEKSGIIRFVGNYDFYKEEKLKLIEKWDNDFKLFLKKKDKLEQLLASARKISDGKSRGKAVSSAKKRIERETKGENEKHKYESKRLKDIEFVTDITHRKMMLAFKNVSKVYDTREVFKDLNFSVLGGEKVWLYGPNGAGKSTIVKMIAGDEQPTHGEIEIGNNVKMGYFAQKQSKILDNRNLLTCYLEETGCAYGKAFGELKKFLFENDDLKKPVKNLSPGQRARFALAIFTHNNYDLLILDEPTNHLDIETKEVVENSLREFKGTVVLVSHDRYFVERVGITKMANLRNATLSVYNV